LTCAAAVLSLFVGSAALAQTSGPKPAHAPTKKQPAKPTTPDANSGDTKKASDGYPDTPKKELYADVDLRGKPAPAFKVEKWITPGGEPDRKGKTVLIDFWATWCGPCKKLMPELAQWQKEFKDDLVVIGVSDEKPDVVEKFVKQSTIGYAIATDPQGTMMKAVKPRGIPHVLVISSDGIVRWQGVTKAEIDPLTTEKLKQIIEVDKAARARKSGDSAPAATDKQADKTTAPSKK
jgi:thiol-disulfide isomerase/thioredoxin